MRVPRTQPRPTACVRSTSTFMSDSTKRRTFRAIGRRDLKDLPQLASLDADFVRSMEVIASVLPFRANPSVLEELIDCRRVPDDPIFQLVFPQPGMLSQDDFRAMSELVAAGVGSEQIESAARRIRRTLNPHPGDQVELNVPYHD